jgi:hypothetical protein
MLEKGYAGSELSAKSGSPTGNRTFTTKRFMSLRSPTEHEMQISVMPAWIAGIQVRRMRPETTMSAWIPALHAGMTIRGLRSVGAHRGSKASKDS